MASYLASYIGGGERCQSCTEDHLNHSCSETPKILKGFFIRVPILILLDSQRPFLIEIHIFTMVTKGLPVSSPLQKLNASPPPCDSINFRLEAVFEPPKPPYCRNNFPEGLTYIDSVMIMCSESHFQLRFRLRSN